jgi:hypothetical protein
MTFAMYLLRRIAMNTLIVVSAPVWVPLLFVARVVVGVIDSIVESYRSVRSDWEFDQEEARRKAAAPQEGSQP